MLRGFLFPSFQAMQSLLAAAWFLLTASSLYQMPNAGSQELMLEMEFLAMQCSAPRGQWGLQAPRRRAGREGYQLKALK